MLKLFKFRWFWLAVMFLLFISWEKKRSESDFNNIGVIIIIVLLCASLFSYKLNDY